MIDEQFSPLIDARNADLWKELSEDHQIRLEEAQEPGYLTQFNENEIIIQVDMNNLNPASLTHELLHIYLKDMDVCIANDLKQAVEKDREVNELFSDSLKEHLGNCLEHHKMLPLYLERGFRPQDFVADYHDRIMDEEELKDLRSRYEQEGSINQEAFDTYVGKFYSIKSSNNRHYDYSDILLGLEAMDPELYEVLQDFWEAWDSYQITDAPEVYRLSLQQMLQGLRKWRQGKRLVMEEEK